ncbi:sensor histidine kinase [Caulobacter sp. DWR1-3-2b1]|uniref:sensor histidine kinase n=1 Tax=Caulobacter sp. DWR1-3-2b1 TaxID=2804670 RepID=UPI003CEA0DBB
MGALIRAHDWSATSLGAPDTWPAGLRTALRLMLNAGHPMYVWWGPELLCFYNDAYSVSIGPERHPTSLGRPGREVWAEIWDIVGPQAEQVMEGRGSTWRQNELIPITRNGRREDVWWTYSYSPIDEPAAPRGVGGVLVICAETTDQVLLERRATAERENLAQLFEQAPTFMAMLKGPEHRIERANPGYMRLIGDRDVLGRTVAEALPDAVEQGYLTLLDQVFTTGEPFRATAANYAVRVTAGGAVDERVVDFVYQPIKDLNGKVSGIFIEGVDVTERTRAEAALRESEHRFRTLADQIPTLCWMAHPDGHIFWYNSRWYDYTGETPADQEGWGWQSVHHPDVLPDVMALWGRSLNEGLPFEMTFPLKGEDGVFRPFLTRVNPLRDEQGRIVRWFGTNTDVSDHHRQEQHLRLMVDELNHRVKNTLATVQSITEQTLRREQVSPGVREVLVSRLIALSRAHDVLTSENWTGADLKEVVAQAVEPFQAGVGHRFSLAGPSVWLTPQAAIAMALVIHELATNAVKYGGLSNSEGRVSLTWTCQTNPDGVDLQILWKESGGPPVSPPTRTGFGTRLIERGLAAELRGPIKITYPVEGVVCTLNAKLDLAPQAGSEAISPRFEPKSKVSAGLAGG